MAESELHTLEKADEKINKILQSSCPNHIHNTFKKTKREKVMEIIYTIYTANVTNKTHRGINIKTCNNLYKTKDKKK